MNQLTAYLSDVKVPQRALRDLNLLFVPEDTPQGGVIRLVITVADKNINLRQLGAYLSLVDRLYGRLSPQGLQSYSQTETAQLRITEIRQGSWEIIIEHLLSQGDATPLIIVYLLLKYLPNMMKAAAESVKHLASAYHEYEDGRLARENRKQMKVQLQRDEKLQELSPTRRDQLLTFLELIYAKESENLSTPKKFAEEYVQAIQLTVERQPEATEQIQNKQK